MVEGNFDKIMTELFDKAFSDGVVTDDEFELIQNVELSLETFTQALDKAKEDQIITPEEHLHLDELKYRILSKARETANLDGVIDKDESAILSLLSKILTNMVNEE